MGHPQARAVDGTIRPHSTDQARLLQIVSDALDPTFGWDINGRLTGCNHAASELAGRPVATLRGTHVSVLAPDVPTVVLDAVLTAVAGGEEVRDVEIGIAGPGDAQQTFLLAAAPVRDESGSVVGGVASMRDITAIRAEMDRLHDTVNRYRTLIDHSPAVTYTEDVETGIVSASPQILPLTGFTQEELASRQNFWFDFVHPDDLERVGEVMAAADATHQPYAVDMRVYRKDGRMMWLHNRGVIHRNSDGSPRYWQGFLLDNTERILIEQERANLAELLGAVFDASPMAMMVTDAEGNVVMWNPTAERLFGWTRDEIVGQPIPLIPENATENVGTRMAALLRGEQTFGEDTLRKHKDGTLIDVSVSSAPIRDPSGVITGTMAMYLDIRETKEANARLREAEHMLRSLVEHSPSVVYRTSAVEVSKVLYMSPQMTALTGRSVDEILAIGAGWYEVGVHPDDAEMVRRTHVEARLTGQPHKIEYRIRTLSGGTVWVQDECRLIRDESDEPMYWQGLIIDISHRKELEAELRHQAFHDALTGLPNRALLLDRCDQAMKRARRNGQQPAMLFLDIDNFKVINDSLGHGFGDAILIDVAQRLAAALRDADTISRFGGDEFAILLGQIDDVTDAISVAERVRAALEPAMTLENRQIIITASIGIAHADASVQTPDDLLRRSDIAMYRAKREGRNRVAVFDAALHEMALQRLEVESDLRRAIAEEQFELHFQPIYTLTTDEVDGFEALLRWNHPTRRQVAPAEFIPVAEDSGLIVPIGEWVLESACQKAVEWRDRTTDGAPVRISVNLSPRQFQQPDLVKQVEATLRSTGLDPNRLTIEVTESVIMDDIDLTVSRLRELKALGVRIAIDDFGTGYSSLTYVKRFPVDVLKIDRSFVSGLGVTTADAAIISATLTLAHTLGIAVVAEGVETELQRDTLVALGCDGAQGYYFSRPLPALEAQMLLSSRRDSGLGIRGA